MNYFIISTNFAKVTTKYYNLVPVSAKLLQLFAFKIRGNRTDYVRKPL